jgi:4-hydroxybutyrate dehydrogenase/sulfolactaldehyde 3-reductase
MATVGFIGLGIMGAPMARNLIKGGHIVRAYDIDQAAIDALVDDSELSNRAQSATSPADAASGADFVITMVPNGSHVKEVVFGAEGVVEGIDREALFIDMSTILPTDTDAIGARLAEDGVHMIDAPVGRTSQHAIEGKLLIMAGGDAADVERARPLFDLLGDSVVHCGALGMGARMKIVNNYLAIAANVLTAEALTLAEAIGLEVELTREVLCGTTAGRGHLNTTYPAQVLAGNLKPGFMVELADKDMNLALELAGRVNAPTAMGAVSRQMMSIAKNQGRGRDDWTSIYQVVRELAGLKP